MGKVLDPTILLSAMSKDYDILRFLNSSITTGLGRRPL